MDQQAGNCVNIVVTSYNRKEATVRAIKSIIDNTDHSFKLTVVDDASTDDTQSYLKYIKTKGKIDNLYLLKKNMGVAIATNMGIFAENTPFSMKFDNDNVIHKDNWLTTMTDIAQKDKNIGTVAYDIYTNKKNGITPYCGGSVLLIPKNTIDTVGAFCEDYGRYGEEDSDFGLRVRLAGLKNYYVAPNGAVTHEHDYRSYGSPELDSRRTRQSRRGSIYMAHFNSFLYQNNIRPLLMARRYIPILEDDFLVDFKLSEEYENTLKSLDDAKKIFSKKVSFAVEKYISGQ